jgi:hypothetical protein
MFEPSAEQTELREERRRIWRRLRSSSKLIQ